MQGGAIFMPRVTPAPLKVPSSILKNKEMKKKNEEVSSPDAAAGNLYILELDAQTCEPIKGTFDNMGAVESYKVSIAPVVEGGPA